MSSTEDSPEAPSPDDTPRGDQEATWLITTPPPPPPPLGAPLPAPEAPRPTGPPPVLPTASTPPVNAPAAEPGGPSPGPAPAPQTPPGDATTLLAAQAATTTPVGPTSDEPTVASEAPAGEPPDPGAAAAAGAAGPAGPIFVPPGASGAPGAAGVGSEGTGEAKGPASHRHPLAGGTAAARSVWREVSDISPWHLASAAILVAFVVSWFAGILLSFRHTPGLTARGRVLQFFAPGSLGWALAVALAIALFEVGRRLDPIPPADASEIAPGAHQRKKRFVGLLPLGLFLAGAAVTVSALVGVLVELSNFGNGIDAAFSSLLSYLALVGIGAAETWLAFREYGKGSL